MLQHVHQLVVNFVHLLLSAGNVVYSESCYILWLDTNLIRVNKKLWAIKPNSEL